MGSRQKIVPAPARKSYLQLLNKLTRCIVTGNIRDFINWFETIHKVICNESREFVLSMQNDPGNPLFQSNLIIFVCKNEQYKTLEYLFGTGEKILLEVYKKIGMDFIHPSYTDSSKHSALYYAVRSNDVKLVDLLIKKWPEFDLGKNINCFEDILSVSYQDLRLRNVTISSEMASCVERRLLDFRLAVNGKRHNSAVTMPEIIGRLDWLVSKIRRTLDEDSCNQNKILLQNLKTIAKNIYVLKSLLRSTYEAIPWEEMEFCLLTFVRTRSSKDELNILYYSFITKNAIISHLKNFAECLELEKTALTGKRNVNELKSFPTVKRHQAAKMITEKYPFFQALYLDFERSRDIRSLAIMKEYMNACLTVDTADRDDRLVIVRTLQVIGQCFRNTFESPMLTDGARKRLFSNMNGKTRKIVIDIRNSLPSSFVLSKRAEQEDEDTIEFFSELLTDMQVLSNVVKNMTDTRIFQQLKKYINVLVECNELDVVEEITALFRSREWGQLTVPGDIVILQMLMDQLRDMASRLSISVHTLYFIDRANLYFTKVERCCTFSVPRDVDCILSITELWVIAAGLGFINTGDKLERLREKARELVDMFLAYKDSKLSHSFGFNVINFLTAISKHLGKNEYFAVYQLVSDIIDIICILDDDSELIEELHARLRNHNTEVPFDCYEQYPLIEKNKNVKNDSIAKLIPEIKRIVNTDNIGKNKSYQVYHKEEKSTKLVLELLMVESLYFVGHTQEYKKSDHAYVEARVPLLHGPNLLDYLLCKTEMAEIYSHDLSMSIANNARLIVLEKVAGERKYQNYKQPLTDVVSLIEQDRHITNVVDFQQQLFQGLTDGCMSAINNSMENGADIFGRSWDNLTALHYAAKGSSTESLKNLLAEWKGKADVKNFEGVNPLHIAVYNDQVENVKLLLTQGKIPVDAPDNFGRTSLHYSVSTESAVMTNTLLAFKADTNAFNQEGQTPLKQALYAKNIEASKIILNHEKFYYDDITIGPSPLEIAAEMGLSELLPTFIKYEGKPIQENRCTKKSDTKKLPTPLHYAARNGHLESINILLQNGWGINTELFNGDTPLFCGVLSNGEDVVRFLVEKGADTKHLKSILLAAEKGNTKIIEMLIAGKALVNIVEPSSGLTPLHVAAFHNRTDVVELLLKNGARVNAKENDGRTALHFCAQREHYELSKVLMKYGARTNIGDKMDFFPHCYAVIAANQDIVELMVTNANVNTVDYMGYTALHRSCLEGYVGIVGCLLEKGAKVNVKAMNERTPLHIAALNGHLEIVKLLLDKGASLNDIDSLGYTAFHYAAAFGRKQIMAIFIQKGANINQVNEQGFSPLYLACARGSFECVSLLIAKGCSINAKAQNGSSPLGVSASGNNKEIVELLVMNKVEITEDALVRSIRSGSRDVLELLLNCSPAYVKNPKLLLTAVVEKQVEIIKILVMRGADINAKGYIVGERPLHLAVNMSDSALVQALLDLEADPNVKSDSGETPMHIAAESGYLEIAEVLLKHKAKILTKVSKGRTSLDFAVERGHTDIVELFLSHDKSINLNNWVSTCHRLPLLHIAVGQLQVVKLLVEKGADVNLKNGSGRKAIHFAASGGHADTVEFFLSKGMSLYDSDTGGNNVLHHVAEGSGDRLNIAKLLLCNKRMDPNRVNKDGRTPLHLAVLASGNVPLIKLFLENGAYYDVKDSLGVSVKEISTSFPVRLIFHSAHQLIAAAKRGDLLEVRNCIRQGAVVDVKNQCNATPLLYATWKGNSDVVNELLSRGANPNTAGKSKSTPLHYASKSSHYVIVLELLRSGAVFEPLNEGNKTPLNYATNKKISKILKLLDDTFLKIKLGDVEVIKSIRKAKLGPKELSALFNCRDRDGKSILACAILAKFPAVECLQSAFHDNQNIEKTRKSLSTGNFREALRIAESEKIQRQALFCNDSLMNVALDLVIVLALCGERRYDIALHKLETVYDTVRNMLGEEAEMTIEVESLKAVTFLEKGEIRRAVKLFEAVHEKQKSVLNPLHPNLIRTQKNYGVALMLTGKLESALELDQHLVERCQIIYGCDHPVTLDVQNDIANILVEKGRLDDALEILENVLEKRRKVLGSKNRETLLTMLKVGWVYSLQNRFKDSLKMVIDASMFKSGTLNKLLNVDKRDAINNLFSLLKKGQAIDLSENNANHQYKFEQEMRLPGLSDFAEIAERSRHRVGGFIPPSDFPGNRRDSLENSIRMNLLRNLGFMFSERSYKNEEEFVGSVFSRSMNSFQDTEEDSSDDDSIAEKRIDKTAAFQAIARGEVGVVAEMIDSGLDFNATDDEGRTPLHYAVCSGNAHLVESLIKNGAQVNVKSKKGNTPLHTAALAEREDIATILMNHVEDAERCTFIDTKTSKTGMTALHIAASKGRLEVVKALLKNGAAYSATNNDHKSPLDLSVNKEVTSLLNALGDIFKTVTSTIDFLEGLKIEDRNVISASRNPEGDALLTKFNKLKDLLRARP